MESTDRPQDFKPGNRAAKGRKDKGWQGRKPRGGLTPQAERFAHEYCVDLDGAAAVMRAGYKSGNHNSALSKACHLLATPAVAALVASIKAKQADRLAIKADRVLLELARMAYLDPGELAKAGVSSPSDIATLPEDVRRAICGWKWDAEGNFIIQWSPKQAALEALGRHLKLFVDRVEVKEVGGFAERLARARARAAARVAEPAAPASGQDQEAPAPG